MKKIICILLCAAALLLLAACGESGTLSAPYGFSLVSDTKIVDYALFVPSTWTVDKQGGITAAGAGPHGNHRLQSALAAKLLRHIKRYYHRIIGGV